MFPQDWRLLDRDCMHLLGTQSMRTEPVAHWPPVGADSIWCYRESFESLGMPS